MIIGNLTRDPEQRTVGSQNKTVCNFTVAVNRIRTQSNHPEADFFRVTAWDRTAENCMRYLAKGRKVCVLGPVRVSTYTGQDGNTRASMEVNAEQVQFLSPREQESADQASQEHFTPVQTDDLPF